MQKHMMMRAAVLCALVMPAAGCVSFTPKRAPEPPVIVIRNSTQQHIKSVVLAEAEPAAGRSARYGEIAPVPAGVSQTFIRPDETKLFPRNITVIWTLADGRRQTETIDLHKLLKTSKGLSNEVLVFDIIRSGRVIAFIEHTQL
jgi:hypothetical protein